LKDDEIHTFLGNPFISDQFYHSDLYYMIQILW